MANDNLGLQDDNIRQERFLKLVIIVIIALGIGLISAGSAQLINDNVSNATNLRLYIIGWGTLMLVAGASYFAGGLVGFLFGVPKMIQNQPALNSAEPSREGQEKMLRKRAINQNDNLVQISDWITKIIVGVGLTQLHNIPSYLIKVGNKLAVNFGSHLEQGRNIVIVTILYFSITGFLSLYLWTRLNFTRLLEVLEKDLDELRKLEKDVDTLKKMNNKAQESSVSSERIITTKAMDQDQPIQRGNISSLMNSDDPQKGKWGGQAEQNGRKLTASIQQELIPGYYRITLKVISTNPEKPLTGFVQFHLHNTFRNLSPVIAVEKNEAVLNLKMVWGAFTVGAEVDEGNSQKTILELDLAELPDFPKDFRER